jgi:hypothetical protein
LESGERGSTRLRVGDVGWYAQLDLGARVSLTPNVEVTSNALAALAHSRKPPVTRPLTPRKDLRIHANSVIAHSDSEIGIAKSDFGLNMAGLRMLVRIADRFACDAISLITNDGGQLAAPTLHDYAILWF